MIYKADIEDSNMASPVLYCRTFQQYQEILNFRHIEYHKHLKEVTGLPDPFDCRSHLLFTINSEGLVDSTMRIAVDSELGLPLDEEAFGNQTEHLRDRGYKLLELGRFHTHNSSQSLLKSYYTSVMSIAEAEQADIIVMAMQHRHIHFHEKIVGVEVVDPMLKTNFGSTEPYATVLWDISNTKSKYFNWISKS